VKEFITKPSVIYTYFGMAAVVFVTTSLITWLSTYFQNVTKVPQVRAGLLASAVMLMAIIGGPLGGFLTDRWRKKKANARLMLPALSTLLTAFLLFAALYLFKGAIQYVTFLLMGVSIFLFIAGAAAVTQDVIHPGLRAASYSFAVIIQNLLGSSTAPIAMGKIYDLSNIQTALSVLPFVLLLGSLLFYLGSRHYVRDMDKVTKINLEAAA
jgi:MFS family permease